MKIVDCDYFVVGSGMAGLMSALHLASYGKVVVVSKGRLQDCNSNFAQGGICCVADPADTFDRHARDTMIAGAWLGKSEVVHEICEHAPEGIQDLIDCGVKFNRKSDGSWDLTREGGHSARRIFHAGDITGEKCEAAMIRRVRRAPVDIREQTIVIDLVMTKRIGLKGPNRCIGAYVLDKPTGEIYAVRSPNTILADAARSTSIRATPIRRRATESPLRGARARRSRTWSSSSSIRRACSIRRPGDSSYRRRCAERARFSWTGTAGSS